MFVFITWTCCCVAMTGHIEVGLDEELALPKDSEILDYLDQLSTTIKLGPEVYFVVEDGYDYSDLDAQNKICSGSGCHEDSLLGQIFKASEHPEMYVVSLQYTALLYMTRFYG